MVLPTGLRKLTLTMHITASVGWLGAVAAYLALAVIALTAHADQQVRATYLAMKPTVWLVVVPLSLASLVTGILTSLSSKWGLIRHYWVLFKLALNLLATTVLLLYTQSIGSFAALAAKPVLSDADLAALRDPTHVVHAAGGLLVLLTATVLAVYKPRGITRYGQPKQRHAVSPGRTSGPQR